MPPELIYQRRLADLQKFNYHLQNKIPFHIVKFNDGEWHAMTGRSGTNCDNHSYSSNLAIKLTEAYRYFLGTNVLISDYIVNQCAFTAHDVLAKRLGKPKNWFVNFAILHDKPYRGIYPCTTPELKQFYTLLHNDTRKKILVAPDRLQHSQFLNVSQRVWVPQVNAFDNIGVFSKQVAEAIENDSILLLCCGFSSCLIAQMVHKLDPTVTIIDIGSGIDPIIYGRTRKSQIDTATLRQFYAHLNIDWKAKVEHTYNEIDGWFNYADYYKQIVAALPNNAHIVEVGVWKGKSSLFLATEIKNSGKNIKLDCIDHFKGTPSELSTTHKEATYKNIKGICCNNLRAFWLTDSNDTPYTRVDNILRIIPLDSMEAVEQYAPKSLDFCFIDSDHTEAGVTKEIKAWLPKMKSGGILAGHDYSSRSFPGVAKAVNKLLKPVTKKSKSCWEYRVPT